MVLVVIFMVGLTICGVGGDIYGGINDMWCWW